MTHPQVTITLDLQVDQLIAPLVQECWRLGCITLSSCQDPPYITLNGLGTADLLVRGILRLTPHWNGAADPFDTRSASMLLPADAVAIEEAVQALKSYSSLREISRFITVE